MKSRFRFVPIAHDTCAVISELSETLLYGELYPHLLPLVDGRRTEDEIAEELAEVIPLEQVYFHLLRLEKLGFIEEHHHVDTGAAAFWDAVGGDLDRMRAETLPTPVRLIAVGGADPEHLRRYFLGVSGIRVVDGNQIGEPLDDSLWVVLTRDYLEPELEEINRRALEFGRPWYLVKPEGVQPWIGPLFTPGQSGCWECLAERLRGHRTIETYAAREHRHGEPFKLSIAGTESSISTATSLLAADVTRMRAGCERSNLDGVILSLDFRTLELRKHRLFRLSGCPACVAGDSRVASAGPQEKPFHLVSRKKSGHRDGGHRIRTAAETLKALKPHMSPICGLIGSILPLRAEERLFGHLFQATYPTARTKECFRLEKADIRGVSNGKGHSETQAMVSAMAEAIERFSALRPKGDSVVRAPFRKLKGTATPPTEMLLLSDRQWAEHGAACRRSGLVDPYEESTPIDWTPCWSFSRHRWTLVPSTLVNHPLPSESGMRYLSNASNGLASGNCLEEAVLHALFEVIEREALGLWWYNRLSVAALDIASFGDHDADETTAFLDEHGWDLHVLDLTTDLEIPVFAGVAVNRTDENADPLLGSGAHFDPRIALRRALGEVAQAWHGRPDIYRASEYCLRNGLPKLRGMDFLQPRSERERRRMTAFDDKSSDDLLVDIQLIRRLLGERGLDLLVADLSRPEVPLKTVRVLVPGMRSAHRHFGDGRLYDVPVLQGRLVRQRTEEELNPVPFMPCLNRTWEDAHSATRQEIDRSPQHPATLK